MNENYELMLGDGGNLYWFPESDKRLMCNIGQVEEEYVDVVQDVLKELKQLREENRSVLLRLYELQGQLNTLHRGEEE
jgi:hypothetical protein